jgi:hypothetical protein
MWSAVAAAGSNKDLVDQIIDTWNEFVAVSYVVENVNVKAMNENVMLEEYKKIKDMTPQFKIDKKTGKISIKGLK